MNFKIPVVILLAAFLQSNLSGQPDTYFLNTKVVGQPETYSVKKTSFSTDIYDEFSPVCYKNGIVFCTNKPSTRIMGYSTEDNKGFMKIFFIDSIGISQKAPKFFSKKLNTKFNDGPVTFNSKGDTIYYSRNTIIDGKMSEISGTRNKLGIFYSVFDGYDWTKTRELRLNNERYNITTPWLSPDGNRLYFASDKPGGYGGSDIYYSQWKNDYWEDPVNMGPVINTKGNESYPFINGAGEFFFSSDGHHGLGGKDIFFARYADSSWIEPVCLEAPINSPYDDFGIYTDTLMQEGYFSSNRDKSIDIFQFKTNFPQVFYNSVQQENNYCYIFSDSGSIPIDTTYLRYKWSFGDGATDRKPTASHCYQSPGEYNVRLDIIEKSTNRLFFSKLIYDLKIIDIEQAYVSSPDYAAKGEDLSFDGLKSYLPGYKIISYSWDFGDGSRSKGDKVTHSFAKKGVYDINLELALRSVSNGLIKKTGVTKKITIVDDPQEAKSLLAQKSPDTHTPHEVRKSANATVLTKYSAESEFKKDAVFRIELLSSKNKMDTKSNLFRNVPSIYKVKEMFDPGDSVYSYTVEQQLNLMATYPSYVKLASLGYTEAKIKLFVLKEPAEKELNNLIRINGAFADSYFDNSDRLTSNAFIMLDQIVRLMKKYSTLKLEVAVHTDNSSSSDINMAASQKRAQLLVDYLVTRGISIRRLVPVGYGSSKPIAGNYLEKDKKLNRRIDFIIFGN
jgi:outer membrane protein OmpA-like peptidoglycan-associated protein